MSNMSNIYVVTLTSIYGDEYEKFIGLYQSCEDAVKDIKKRRKVLQPDIYGHVFVKWCEKVLLRDGSDKYIALGRQDDEDAKETDLYEIYYYRIFSQIPRKV